MFWTVLLMVLLTVLRSLFRTSILSPAARRRGKAHTRGVSGERALWGNYFGISARFLCTNVSGEAELPKIADIYGYGCAPFIARTLIALGYNQTLGSRGTPTDGSCVLVASNGGSGLFPSRSIVYGIIAVIRQSVEVRNGYCCKYDYA